MGWKYLHHARRALPGMLSNNLRLGGRAYQFEAPRDAGFLAMVFVETIDYLRAFEMLGRAGAVVVDVGAHLGESAVALGTLLREPRIVAFEPNPAICPLLRFNTRHLDIEINQVGLSNIDGVLPYRIGGASSANGGFLGEADNSASSRLPVARGDILLDQVQSIDLMKLDVEGHELQAIQGLEATLPRVQHLVVEVPIERGRWSNERELGAALPGFELVGMGAIAHPRAAVGSANAYYTNSGVPRASRISA